MKLFLCLVIIQAVFGKAGGTDLYHSFYGSAQTNIEWSEDFSYIMSNSGRMIASKLTKLLECAFYDTDFTGMVDILQFRQQKTVLVLEFDLNTSKRVTLSDLDSVFHYHLNNTLNSINFEIQYATGTSPDITPSPTTSVSVSNVTFTSSLPSLASTNFIYSSQAAQLSESKTTPESMYLSPNNKTLLESSETVSLSASLTTLNSVASTRFLSSSQATQLSGSNTTAQSMYLSQSNTTILESSETISASLTTLNSVASSIFLSSSQATQLSGSNTTAQSMYLSQSNKTILESSETVPLTVSFSTLNFVRSYSPNIVSHFTSSSFVINATTFSPIHSSVSTTVELTNSTSIMSKVSLSFKSVPLSYHPTPTSKVVYSTPVQYISSLISNSIAISNIEEQSYTSFRLIEATESTRDTSTVMYMYSSSHIVSGVYSTFPFAAVESSQESLLSGNITLSLASFVSILVVFGLFFILMTIFAVYITIRCRKEIERVETLITALSQSQETPTADLNDSLGNVAINVGQPVEQPDLILNNSDDLKVARTQPEHEKEDLEMRESIGNKEPIESESDKSTTATTTFIIEERFQHITTKHDDAEQDFKSSNEKEPSLNATVVNCFNGSFQNDANDEEEAPTDCEEAKTEVRENLTISQEDNTGRFSDNKNCQEGKLVEHLELSHLDGLIEDSKLSDMSFV